MLLVLPGCPFSPDSDGGDDQPTTPVPERDSVTGAIDLYEFVWAKKRYDLYQDLLHDSYEYFPQNDDLTDFPWIGGDSWGRATELGMAQNMFDENFVSEDTGNSVDTIEMDFVVLSERSVPEGVEVEVSADILVLWATNTGASSDVRFQFTIVPDPDEPGLFQIARQDELPAF